MQSVFLYLSQSKQKKYATSTPHQPKTKGKMGIFIIGLVHVRNSLIAKKLPEKRIIYTNSLCQSTKLNYMLEDHHPGSIVKTFVFQKEQTQHSTFVQREIDPNSTIIDISSLLIMYCPTTQFQVSIYDPVTNKFVSLQKIKALNGLIPIQYLQSSVILIKFRNLDEKIEDQNAQSDSDSDDKNKQDIRSRQRTIRQVIALVKRWRQLIDASKPGKANKRMNLQEAAREIGVSKKILDDYYCQLRLAELHNFNFTQNADERIGKLRTFVKEHRTEEAARGRHQKQHKNLRVIEEFVIDKAMEEYIILQRQMGDSQRKKDQSKYAQVGLENPFLNQFSSHKIFQNLEDEYYKGFQFLLDEPSDPFLCDNEAIKKKPFEDFDENNLFF